MSGTQAPSGTFFSAAPQNKPTRIHPLAYCALISLWVRTVNEAEEDEVRKSYDDRQLFHVAALNGYEDRSREHNCRHCESAGSKLSEGDRSEKSL